MEVKYSRGGLLGWLQERWFEFRQGHNTYLGFVLSFVNFVLIAYSLFLQEIFKDLTLFQFCVVFGAISVPASRIFGRVHIHIQARYDTGMIFNQNPGLQAMMNKLIEIEKILQESKERERNEWTQGI